MYPPQFFHLGIRSLNFSPFHQKVEAQVFDFRKRVPDGRGAIDEAVDEVAAQPGVEQLVDEERGIGFEHAIADQNYFLLL
jgi:hypothetical protein